MTNELALYNGADLKGQKLINVGDPAAASDGVNKSYVDNFVNGKPYKESARVATTGNITLASAPASIDTVALVSGQRVLVKNQTAATENGIYVFNGTGAAMTRSLDMDAGSEFLAATVTVREGSAGQADSEWSVVTDGTGGVITVGTDNITWTNTGSGINYTAAQGVQRVGNEFRANIDGTTVKLTGNALRVDPTVVGDARKFATDNGDMTGGTALTITDNLNTLDKNIFAYLKSTGERVALGEKVTGLNTCSVVAAASQSAGLFRIVVEA